MIRIMGGKPDSKIGPKSIQYIEKTKESEVPGDAVKKNYAYIGKDGNDYYDNESLQIANEAYARRTYQFIPENKGDYKQKESGIVNCRYDKGTKPKRR